VPSTQVRDDKIMLAYIQVKNVEEAKKTEIAIEKAAPIWYNVIDKKQIQKKRSC